MSRTAHLEDRLANYRSTLDAAIAERSAGTVAPFDDVAELDVEPAGHGGRSGRSGLLVAAAGLVVVGGLVAVVALRDEPVSGPDAPVASGPSATADASQTSTLSTQNPSDPDNTAPPSSVAQLGSSPRCPADTGTLPVATLYLGGPPSDQNLAAPGFIFSLPSGPPIVDVALKAISMPVLGLDCGIDASPTSDPSVVAVHIEPPATPSPLQLAVTIVDRDGVVGATAIQGDTLFEADPERLRLVSGVPANASTVYVRFKKGEDVWQLSVPPDSVSDVALQVPAGDTDRFTTDSVDWVLFTVHDDQGRLLDAGGRLTAP